MKVIIYLLLLVLGIRVADNLSLPEESTVQEDKEIVLTERQKEILRELELPEEYDELTTRQANGITYIDEMLTYLEEKYDEEFWYLEFSDGWYGGEIYLEAYPVSKGIYEKVTVTVADYDEEIGRQYEDDYACILYESNYQEDIEKFASQYFDMEYCKVYVDLTHTENDITDENVLSKSSAIVDIFIDDLMYSLEDINNFMDGYSQWLWEQSGEVGSLSIIYLFASEAFDEINGSNYLDKTLDHDNIIESINCRISGTDPIKIF